jgi:hypothetical protein
MGRTASGATSAASWFETRRYATLLTMRRINEFPCGMLKAA